MFHLFHNATDGRIVETNNGLNLIQGVSVPPDGLMDLHVSLLLVSSCILEQRGKGWPRCKAFGLRNREARRRGVIIRPLGDVVVLMPPLSIELEELNQLLEITYQSIKVVTQS